jgi:hypothetical protein
MLEMCFCLTQRDPSIAGVVVDSPFSRLTDLMMEICEEQKLPVPKIFLRLALSIMKRSVKNKAKFDLDKVRLELTKMYEAYCKNCRQTCAIMCYSRPWESSPPSLLNLIVVST